jgi:hypothetical protein
VTSRVDFRRQGLPAPPCAMLRQCVCTTAAGARSL